MWRGVFRNRILISIVGLVVQQLIEKENHKLEIQTYNFDSVDWLFLPHLSTSNAKTWKHCDFYTVHESGFNDYIYILN